MISEERDNIIHELLLFHTCTSIQSIVSVVRAGAAVNNSTISFNDI